MKVLSLKQPFAELVVEGKKKIELRNWNTKFRGEFLIHASKIPDKAAMKRFRLKDLPLGCIVGKATLVNVKKYKTKEAHKKDRRLHLASSLWGNYGFILKDVERIELIPCKGKLGFWEYDGDI